MLSITSWLFTLSFISYLTSWRYTGSGIKASFPSKHATPPDKHTVQSQPDFFFFLSLYPSLRCVCVQQLPGFLMLFREMAAQAFIVSSSGGSGFEFLN